MRRWQDLLAAKPEVCSGQLCATSTRVPVTVILDSLAEGASRDEILRSYPTLAGEHIDAALAYAAGGGEGQGAKAGANPYAAFRGVKIAPNHPALAGRELRPLATQPPPAPPAR